MLFEHQIKVACIDLCERLGEDPYRKIKVQCKQQNTSYEMSPGLLVSPAVYVAPLYEEVEAWTLKINHMKELVHAHTAARKAGLIP